MPGGEFQVLHRQVPGTGVTGRAVVEPAGIAPHVGHEFLQVLGRHIGMNDEQAGHFRQQGHRRKVAIHVVAGVAEDVGVDGQRTDMAQDQGVAIGRGTRHLLHGRHAAAAGLVVDDDRAAQQAREFVGRGARDDVRRAARHEGHDETHCPGGPLRLRSGAPGQCGQTGGQGGSEPFAASLHAITSIMVRFVLVKCGRVMSLQAVPRTASQGGEPSVSSLTRS